MDKYNRKTILAVSMGQRQNRDEERESKRTCGECHQVLCFISASVFTGFFLDVASRGPVIYAGVPGKLYCTTGSVFSED